MELIIKCPDCGKDLKVSVEEVKNEPPKLSVFRRVEKMQRSWAEISEMIKEDAEEYFKVGDEIPCTLNDGTEVTFVVAAINPYDDNEIAFVIKDALPGEYHCMNEECSNEGGWKESDMREYLMDHVYNLLPDDLKAIIKKRTITQKQGSKTLTSEDDIWLVSATEIDGKEHKADVGDVHFELFKDERSRVKQNEGKTTWYFTRTAWASYSTYFAYVSSGGGSGNGIASYAHSIVFGFLA